MTKARLETVANGRWMTKDPFTKEQSHARQHAKEYFECYPNRYQTVVDSWRELQSRNIEFTMKRLRQPLK
jgi:hypothetical protein